MAWIIVPGRASARDRECELVEARAHIADAVGHAVDEAAVPLGAYDRRLLTGARRLGYRKVHTSDGRAARAGAWLQPRISVLSTDTPDSLKQQLLETPSRGKLAWLAAKGRMNACGELRNPFGGPSYGDAWRSRRDGQAGRQTAKLTPRALRGVLSGRSRRSFVPCRNRCPCTLS